VYHAIRRFLDELLLSSGQYSLFFIVLAIAVERINLLQNTGILLLTLGLIAQTILLVRFGERTALRFLFSLICPLLFTLIQVRFGGFSPLNMNLLFFWFTQLAFALIRALCNKAQTTGGKKVLEFIISMGTISVFLFLTFYYDLMLSFGVKSAAELLSGAQASDFFSVFNFIPTFSGFITAPKNRFVIYSCLLIGFILGTGRIRIISLKHRISFLFEVDPDSRAIESLPEPAAAATETAEISVLWADIRSFTQITEKSAPEAVVECLNLYFSTWSVISAKYGGVIDKHMGDAVMITFGPGMQDNANQAVNCSLDFLDQLPAFQEEFAIRNLPIVRGVGIGLSCGEVIAADLGGPNKRQRSFLGYPVSVASRMQGLCREFRQDIVIDQNIYRKLSLENQSHFLPLGEVLIRGRTAPMPVYGRK
jgi:class 3 adenylate cyclase